MEESRGLDRVGESPPNYPRMKTRLLIESLVLRRVQNIKSRQEANHGPCQQKGLPNQLSRSSHPGAHRRHTQGQTQKQVRSPSKAFRMGIKTDDRQSHRRQFKSQKI